MNTRDKDKIIETIAKREGISEAEVLEEMKKAILAGYMNPETQHKWSAIFGENRIPSPEEFIKVIGKRI